MRMYHQRDGAVGRRQPGVLHGERGHGLGVPAQHRSRRPAAGGAQIEGQHLPGCGACRTSAFGVVSADSRTRMLLRPQLCKS